MSESALTFSELQIYLAVQLGVAFYGAAGDEAAQAPTDTATLATIKGYANGGFRMFLNDAPPEGWRFQQPIASVVLWPTSSSTVNGTPVYSDPSTTVLANTSIFHDSMVGHNLVFTVTSTANGAPVYDSDADNSTVNVDDAIFAVPPLEVGQIITFTVTGNSYTINAITDTTTVVVDGDASDEVDADTVTITRSYVIASITDAATAVVTGNAASESDGATMTITANGNYTLPSTFGGDFLGPVTYAAASNVGVSFTWTHEGQIRKLRENDSSTGDPYKIAIRKMDATDIARRFEMLVYPIPSSDRTIEFPYDLHFTAMTAAGDLHPAGARFDEAVMAACEAFAEMHGEDALAGRTHYYRQFALPGAYRTNGRMAPKRLGSLLKREARFEDWRDSVQRPDVTVIP